MACAALGLERRVAVVVAAGLALVVLALWISAGFVNGIYEEWLFLEMYREGMSPLNVGDQFLRPLVLVPYYLGLALTPGSFIGLNLVLMFVLWGRSMALFLVLRQIGARAALAMAAAFILILYPADDGLISLRFVANQFSVMLLVFSTYLLLRFARTLRPSVALALAACLAVTLLTYEAPFPLALVCPLVLVWTEGVRRRALFAAGLWYAVLVPVVARYAHGILTAKKSYQASLLVIDGSFASLVEAAKFLGAAYARTLSGGWLEAVGDLAAAPLPNILVGLAVSALAAILIAKFDSRQPEPGERPERRFLLALGLAALAVVGLGFAMYLPSAARTNTWRTLFLPSIGGALVVAVLLRLISGAVPGRRRVFATAVGVLLFPAFVHLLAQHRAFSEIATNQRHMIDGIVEAVPKLSKRAKLLLVFDETDRAISHAYFPFSRYLRAAIGSYYKRADLVVHICYPFVLRRNETCTFDRDSVRVDHQDIGWGVGLLRRPWDIPYEAVVAVNQDRSGRIRLLDSLPSWYTLQEGEVNYDPRALVDAARDFQPELGKFHVEFDEQAFVGAGWDRERKNRAGITYRFMSNETAAMHFPLSRRAYRLEFRIANGISPKLLASVRASIGPHAIELERVDGASFRGMIPSDLVAEGGETTLLFHQDPEALREAKAQRGPLIGLGFDWVTLEPVAAAPPEDSKVPAAGPNEGADARPAEVSSARSR